MQLINASARFELISANQQLIDFHLNRVMQAKLRKLQKPKAQTSEEEKGNISQLLSGYKAQNTGKMTDYNERLNQMQNPHLVMQTRMHEMSPLMFGDTLRLPMMFKQA